MAPKKNKPVQCPCCNQVIGENFSSHKETPLHIFNFYLWAYRHGKRALCKNKDGVCLDVHLIDAKKRCLELDYNEKRGKYTLEVKPEQLFPENKVEFRLSILNDRREDDIHLTAARTLDASPLFSCYDDKLDWIRSGNYVRIKPKEKYKGVVLKFQVSTLIVGSYKVPFALNLQTEDGKTDLLLCRSIVVRIVGSEEKEELIHHMKSPFTHQAWDEFVNIIRPRRTANFACNYPIPNEFAECFKRGLNEWKQMSVEDSELLELLKAQMEPGHVTKENYEMFFHNCLWLEEIMEALMLQSYNMENVRMSVHGNNMLKLEVPGLAEKRPSLIAGDVIRMRIHEDHTGYEGHIKLLEDQHVVIEYVDPELWDMIYSYPKLEIDVAFQLGRLPLERSHRAVDIVSLRGLKKMLFPDDLIIRPYESTFELKDNDFVNKKIIENPEQKTAVEKILNCSSQGAPYIVFGPPGTGKTVTIVEAIVQILKRTKKKVLVCAPTNAGCDMLACKLIPYCTKKELIRIHSDSRDKSSIPNQLKSYSNITKDDQILAFTSREINKFRIVVTTLIYIGRFSGGDYKADFLFIDEAAQAKEPEACVAVSMLMNDQSSLVLAGDPLQLGPVIQSSIAEKYGLNVSLLERLMNTQDIYKNEDPNYISMLKKHFRCHPDILSIPNELFYQSKLTAESNSSLQDPVSRLAVYPNIKKFNPLLTTIKLGSGQAIEFCAVSSKERREGRSPSYYNPAEADIVIEYIKTLIAAPFGQRVQPREIGVITPYIRQVYKIKDLLSRCNYTDVEVGSTEAFQGREKRVIIISTVRAQHSLLKYDKKYTLGFVKQAKRFNVAITRAIGKLVVVGCPTVLANDDKWKMFMMKCRELGSYHGAFYDERTPEKILEIIERFNGFPKPKKTQ